MMTRTWLLLSAAAAFVLETQSAHASSTEKDATCFSDADAGCVAPKTASLLQKVFKHDAKSTNAQEPTPRRMAPNADCTGTTAQGRCWFLSDIGESCGATCAKHGRAFSFAIANPEAPITPRLVFHEPKTQQEPWSALECYVASEDRYHTANENAARHYVDDIGNWSHDNCMLACPCGDAGSDKCTWKQPAACVPKFMWKGVEYSGCATVDLEHERPWCQHSYQHTDKDKMAQDWSYCENICEADEPTRPKEPARPKEPVDAECGWVPAASCVKEFSYKGSQYVGCTNPDSEATPWCSNTENYYGSWSQCLYSCAAKPEPPKPNPIYPGDVEENCTWQPKPECWKTFQYKGVAVEGCTDLDYPTPWCSMNATHTDSWDTCTRVCAQVYPVPPFPVPAPVPVAPVPARPRVPEAPVDPIPVPPRVPAAPVPVPPQTPPSNVEDPCYRGPDVKNDAIGNSVTLDQVGFRITSASESPINMKRFVCRVTAKIGCKVTDGVALLGFVPYFSGLVAKQTYSNLESELNTLCRAEGKWVAPMDLASGLRPWGASRI